MKRAAYNLLLDWKGKPGRKPLIIQGARQVGKTWLMREFGKKEFGQTAYFNFEINKALHSIFKSGFDTSKIISSLNIVAGFKIEPSNTLIILDEITTFKLASTFKHIILSHGSFSALIGYLSFFLIYIIQNMN